MYQFLSIFFIYAFLGWCTEVAYAALKHGKFVNRGFLNGPLCPIYGFGVMLVLLCLEPLREQWFLLFLGSIVLTSALEFLTGFVLEKIFHEHWWDYSDEPFNIGGYVCLRFSIAWGLACTFVVRLFHPTVELLIAWFPHTLGIVLLAVFSATMAVDLAATLATVLKLRRRQARLDAMAARIHALSDSFGENLADRVLDAAETGKELKEDLEARKEQLKAREAEAQKELAELRGRMEQLRGQHVFGQRRLVRAFPRVHTALRERNGEHAEKK